MPGPLEPKRKKLCRWDCVSLGEVMLRLDPGDERIHTTRSFKVWEGGGEYNVARGLKRCFGLDTAIITALADNPVGRLIQDLIYQGGVDQSQLKWVKFDGVGRRVRNGLNFTERGFGIRAALGCSDRGHTAVSQVAPGDFDWKQIFTIEGARWFHTGGIFAALSETTPLVAKEAMIAARESGTLISYDLNYRPSLWQSNGGQFYYNGEFAGTYSNDCLWCGQLVNEMAARGPAVEKLTVAFAFTAVALGATGGAGAHFLGTGATVTTLGLATRAAPAAAGATGILSQLSRTDATIFQRALDLGASAQKPILENVAYLRDALFQQNVTWKINIIGKI